MRSPGVRAAKGRTLGCSDRAKLSPLASQGLQWARLRVWQRGLPKADRGAEVALGAPRLQEGWTRGCAERTKLSPLASQGLRGSRRRQGLDSRVVWKGKTLAFRRSRAPVC